ncbi:MAG: Fe-S-containing protein [Anaerolineae bacterium]
MLFERTRFAPALLAVALLGILALTGCSGTPAAQNTPEPEILTGTITRAQIEALPEWQALPEDDYVPDAATIAAISENRGDVQVLLFIGTWCGDSQREVPRFFEIMDQTGWPEDAVQIVGLDRTKTDAEGLTAEWEIEYVPTFVLLWNGTEIGRIVERPDTTLEGDIVNILAADALSSLKVSPVDGVVRVPAAGLEDGKARFYAYDTADTTVTFFVLRSSDGVVRAALNACDVCFQSRLGYRQEGDEMVCNNCGTRFPSTRINEEQGGCNPSPLARTLSGDEVVIQVGELEAGAQLF